MLNAGTINRIRRDFAILLNGPDGCDCVINWSNPGPGEQVDDVYQTITGTAVTGTLTTRCHVNKIFGAGEITGKKLVDVQPGDAVMLFPKGTDFTGKGNLLFSIQNYGQWILVESPPNVFRTHVGLIVNGESFVESCYMRRLST